MNVFNIFQLFIICFSGVSCENPDPQSHSTEAQQVQSLLPIPGAFQLEKYLPLLQNASVACVVNHSSLIEQTHLVDTLHRLGVQIKTVFAPEHGFRGGADAGEHIADDKDPATGIPIISLYGERKKPFPHDLEGVQVVIFDIQDVGVRFYTYISTLHLMMEACAEAGIPLIVLDRPNPNGYYVDGPVLDPAFRSFVGMHEIPIVYGLTIGELATMINGEKWLANGVQCDVTVIPCQHYDHTMTYDLPVAPSPNLPNLRSILLYPSICFFEGTNVSVGRGTNMQFQVIGHPDYSPEHFSFTPQSKQGASNPPHLGKQLYGTDLTTLTVGEIRNWQRINLKWLIDYHRLLDPQNVFFLEKPDFFDKLAGTDQLRIQLEEGWNEDQIRNSWSKGVDEFLAKRKNYLLYADFH